MFSVTVASLCGFHHVLGSSTLLSLPRLSFSSSPLFLSSTTFWISLPDMFTYKLMLNPDHFSCVWQKVQRRCLHEDPCQPGRCADFAQHTFPPQSNSGSTVLHRALPVHGSFSSLLPAGHIQLDGLGGLPYLPSLSQSLQYLYQEIHAQTRSHSLGWVELPGSQIRFKPLPVLMPPRHQLMPVDAKITHTKEGLGGTLPPFSGRSVDFSVFTHGHFTL